MRKVFSIVVKSEGNLELENCHWKDIRSCGYSSFVIFSVVVVLKGTRSRSAHVRLPD